MARLIRRATLLALLAAGPAAAQEARPENVLSRARPDAEAPGLRLGAFHAFPYVTAGIAWDDNILARGTGRQQDAVLRLAPGLLFRSDWSRHSLTGEAALEPLLYAVTPRFSGVNARAAVTGRVDVGQAGALTLSGGFQRQADLLLSPVPAAFSGGVPGTVTAEPAIANRLSFGATYTQGIGAFALTGSYSYQRSSFEDPARAVPELAASRRDGEVHTTALRAGWRIGEGGTLFAEAGYNFRRFRTPSFDSDGTRIILGASTDLWGLLQGEVFAGLLHQDFSRGLGRVTGPTFGANLRWFVTPRATATLQGRRDIGEPTTAGRRPGIATSVTAGAELELYRALLFAASYTYAQTEVPGQAPDRAHLVAAGPIWLVNRHTQISATFRHQSRVASTPGGDFGRNILLLQLRLGL